MKPESIVIRGKGRHKLKMLLREAAEICGKYDHQEYAGDFKQIHDGLIHDYSEKEWPYWCLWLARRVGHSFSL